MVVAVKQTPDMGTDVIIMAVVDTLAEEKWPMKIVEGVAM